MCSSGVNQAGDCPRLPPSSALWLLGELSSGDVSHNEPLGTGEPEKEGYYNFSNFSDQMYFLPRLAGQLLPSNRDIGLPL